MRTFKKTLSLILCVLMLSASVVYAESVSIRLDFSEFDNMDPEEFGGLYNSTKLSDIPWDKEGIETLLNGEIESWVGDQIVSWDGENDTAYFHINKSKGRTGAGLSMKSLDNSNSELWFVQEDLAEGKTSIFSYDFKVTRRNASGGNNSFFSLIGGKYTSDGTIRNLIDDSDYIDERADTTNKTSFSENKWYTIVVVVDDFELNGYLLDEDGNELLQSSKTFKSWETTTAVNLARVDGFVENGTEMIIDNIEKHVYYPAETEPEVKISSIESDEKGIARNASFEFAFDQEISGDVVIKNSEGNDVNDVYNVQTTKIAYNKVKVSIGNILDRKTTYTVSFDDIKNSENLSCSSADISFTTEDLHVWDDIDIGNIAQDGDNVNITFTLNDELNYPSFTGAVMAARYEGGVMKAVSSVALTEVHVGQEITKSFALGTLTADSVIKLIQLDLVNGPVILSTSN